MDGASVLTLHNEALHWVCDHVKGGIVNHKARWLFSEHPPYRIERMEPDVIENANRQLPTHKYHEIEVLGIKEKKNELYCRDNHHKTLWIVLPKGTVKAFNSIKMIEETDYGFEPLNVKT